MKLDRIEAFNAIKWALDKINKCTIASWFRHFYKVVKSTIEELTFSS